MKWMIEEEEFEIKDDDLELEFWSAELSRVYRSEWSLAMIIGQRHATDLLRDGRWTQLALPILLSIQA